VNEKIFIKFVKHIPLNLRRRLAVFFGRLFYHFSLKHRLIAMHNLMRAFPEKSFQEIVEIAKESYISSAYLVADFFDIPNLNKDNLHLRVNVEGLENYTGAQNEGKGVILLGAHVGNWEIGNAALAILTRPFVFIYRILDSPFLERGITGVRASYGNVSLPKKDAMRPMIRLLKKGLTVNLLIDQNVDWCDGVFVDFFGRKACTTSGLALLALYTKAPVLPAFTRRLPDGRYLMEIGRKIDMVRSGNREEDILSNTQNFTKVIEDFVRKYPGQWLWVHQRWKTKTCQIKIKKG